MQSVRFSLNTAGVATITLHDSRTTFEEKAQGLRIVSWPVPPGAFLSGRTAGTGQGATITTPAYLQQWADDAPDEAVMVAGGPS